MLGTSKSTLTALVTISFLALAFVSADPAHARKGLPIINTGDIIYRVAELPADLAAENPEMQGWSLGYKASHFGILSADIWCWNKQLVAFQGDTYADLEPEIRTKLEAEYPWSKTERGPWTRFGIFGFGAALIGGAVFKRMKQGG